MDREGGDENCSMCGRPLVGSGWNAEVFSDSVVRVRMESPGEQQWFILGPLPARGRILAGPGSPSHARRLEGRPVAEVDELKKPNRDDG